jgi:hypothetical protein
MNALQALAIAAAAFVTSLSVDGAPPLPASGAARELSYVRADLAELVPFLESSVWISDAASAQTCEPAHFYGRL